MWFLLPEGNVHYLLETNKAKKNKVKDGEVDVDWWMGGDDERLRGAEFVRKKLKNELLISDIYPEYMAADNIKALKKGFWCTEKYSEHDKKKLFINNIFGLKTDIQI